MRLHLFGAKGGVGVSTVAIALAAALTRALGRCVLSERNGSGDLGSMLGLPASAANDSLLFEMVRGAPAAREIAEALLAPPNADLYPARVFDRGPVPFTGGLGNGLSHAERIEPGDRVLVVVPGDYCALRAVLRSGVLEHATGLIHFADPERALGPVEVSDVLHLPIIGTLARRCAVPRTIDAGCVLVKTPAALVDLGAEILDALNIGVRWAPGLDPAGLPA